MFGFSGEIGPILGSCWGRDLSGFCMLKVNRSEFVLLV